MTGNDHPKNFVVRESYSGKGNAELDEHGMVTSTKIVRVFNYNASNLAELRTVLSEDRFATYLKNVKNDPARAMRLYTWNTAMCSAFYGPLQALEVTVRNSMNIQLSKIFGPDWYDNRQVDLDMNTRSKIQFVKTALGNPKSRINPPDTAVPT